MRTEPANVDASRPPSARTSTERRPSEARRPEPVPPRRRAVERAVGLAFVLALVGAAIGVYLLARTGWRTILDSTDGQLAEVITDPALPGYQAVVTPTPSQLLIQLDAGGRLASALVVGLAGDDVGGTVLLVPGATVVEADGGAEQLLSEAWDDAGADGVRTALAGMLDVNFDGVQVLDQERWAALTGPLAPIDVVVPDTLVSTDADGALVTRFPAGPTSLAASEVGEYLGWSNPDESGLNMLVRQELFWEAWLDGIAASSDPGVVPGEVITGLGRFVRALAAGPQDFTTLPVDRVVDADGAERFTVAADEVAYLVVEMLPFPLPATPGSRTLVRVLNGAGGADLTLEIASRVVAAGGQVTIVGNAASFDVERSAVFVASEALRPAGLELASALGIETVDLDPDPNPAVEATVVIGADFPAEGGP